MNILHIDCSPRPESHSRRLSAKIVEKITEFASDANISRRDLGFEPIPHTLPDYAAVLSSPAALAAGHSSTAVQLSEQLIQEVEAADLIVIGTPMNNFTVPSVLKAWIDQILRIGRTIAPTANGSKAGMLQNRPVIVGIASGGTFTGDQANQPDFLTPYLLATLSCIGLKTVHFLPLQNTAFVDEKSVAETSKSLIETIDASMIGMSLRSSD